MNIVSVDMAQPQCDHYFVVREANIRGLTKKDVGAPIIAFDEPVGFIAMIVDGYVYGNIWTRYYDVWRRDGGVIYTGS